MPTPAWRKRLDPARSLYNEMVSNTINDEKNMILGPPGASPTATHPTLGTEIAGKPPRKERFPSDELSWVRNTVQNENADTRPVNQKSTKKGRR